MIDAGLWLVAALVLLELGLLIVARSWAAASTLVVTSMFAAVAVVAASGRRS